MKIFIGGSANVDIPETYIKEAEKLGKKFLHTEHEIYCCGSKDGVVGSIYNVFCNSGKDRVKIAVPKAHLHYNKDVKKIDVVTDTIGQRTDYVLKNCDMAIFLPGGIGTLYEILCAIETKRANEHSCKIVIVNLFGYFDKLMEMLEKVFEEKFASENDKKMYTVVNEIDEIIL